MLTIFLPIFKAGPTQIKFTFQQITRKTTPQEEPEGENKGSTQTITTPMITPVTQERNLII